MDIKLDIDIYITSGERPSSSQSSVAGFEGDDKQLVQHARAFSHLSVNTAITLLSGRPDIAPIIKEVAESALGVMAIVVCGPPAMVQEVRNRASCISDERGVHKGTGAQGIYVHAEAFGYA